MEKFSEWYNARNVEITWWIIGWMSFALFDSLGRGHYFMAMIDAALIYWNYQMLYGKEEE